MSRIPFIVAIIIVAVAMAVGILIFQNRNSSYRDQQYEVQEPVELSYYDCTTGADCVLVQDGWCKTVLAVNKTKEAAWQEDNAKQTEIARQNAQSCELMPEEYFDIKNFRAVCRQSKCIAEFIGNSTQ